MEVINTKINSRDFLIAMAKAKISVNELSKKAQISRSTIAAIKKGKYSIKPDTAGQLADALGIDVTEILED